MPLVSEFPWDGNVGKSNEPVQMDICQVSNEMGEWWRGLGLKESI
jgi:hypothetical protein